MKLTRYENSLYEHSLNDVECSLGDSLLFVVFNLAVFGVGTEGTECTHNQVIGISFSSNKLFELKNSFITINCFGL